MFSKSCEYSIRAVIYIAQQSIEGKASNLNNIAEEIKSPTAFTAKILQKLARKKIINSKKGPNGGFRIDVENMDSVKLVDIVHAIDGEEQQGKCLLGLEACSETKPCPIHQHYKDIKRDFNAMLASNSIESMVLDYNAGNSFLKL